MKQSSVSRKSWFLGCTLCWSSWLSIHWQLRLGAQESSDVCFPIKIAGGTSSLHLQLFHLINLPWFRCHILSWKSHFWRGAERYHGGGCLFYSNQIGMGVLWVSDPCGGPKPQLWENSSPGVLLSGDSVGLCRHHFLGRYPPCVLCARLWVWFGFPKQP